jgi:hypothetical protein
MSRLHPLETRQRAETMFVTTGLSAGQLSALLGISLGTLRKWSVDFKWMELRQEYEQSLMEIRRNTTRLRQRLLEKALESLDPQLVNAVARMESSASRERARDAEPFPCVPDEERRVIETPQEAAAALREAVEKKLNALLSQPDTVSLKVVKELAGAIRLLESIKPAQPAETEATEPPGLSEEAAAEIRRKLLGLPE